MRCKSVLTRIDAVRTDELHPSEENELRGHLSTCRSCDDSLEDVASLAQTLRALRSVPADSCRDRVCTSVSDRFAVVHAGDESVWVAFSDEGVRMITLGSEERFRKLHGERFGRDLVAGTLSASAERQIAAALAGEPTKTPAIDLSTLTPFERETLRILATIPRGEVRTYAWLARQAGRPKAVRAVGTIMARNPLPLLLPCHRVVPSSGGIGNYALGVETKRSLLGREGVSVEELENLERKGVRFIGSKTTHIFCFPTCKDARRIREENRVPFRGESEAEQKGFRPCLRCKPAA